MKRLNAIHMLMAAGLATVALSSCTTMADDDTSVALQPISPIADCIRVDRVGEWYVTDPDTMIVRTGPEYFQIDMQATCPRLGVGPGIQFRIDPSTLGSRRLCGNMLDAVYADEIPCPIQKITPISEKQFRAMEDNAA